MRHAPCKVKDGNCILIWCNALYVKVDVPMEESSKGSRGTLKSPPKTKNTIPVWNEAKRSQIFLKKAIW